MNAVPGSLRIAVNALNLPRKPAGISQYVRNLYRALADLPEIASIEIHASAAAAGFLAGLHPKVRVRAYPVRGSLAGTLSSQLLLPLLVRGADVVHSVGNIASIACPAPQVVTVHDLCHKTIPKRFGPLKRAYLSWGLACSTLPRSIRFVCVSASTLRDLERYHPRASGRATVVHSAARFRSDDAPHSRGQRLLCVGTLEPGKNLALAFRALAILKREGRRLQLDVVGASGWKQSDLPGVLERLGVADQVRFAGFVDEATLLRMYREAALLLFPSRYEGFGFPILEAQSQGCPAVVADNSCMREVGGEGALYFRDDDAEDMAVAITALLDDPGAAAAQVRRGFANVAGFSWERAACETLDAFRESVAAFKS